MAFSLQGFGAGFASKMSQRLDEDRIRQEKLQDEARREATRVRLAKQAEREREKKEIEEKTGLMKALGFSDASIEKALGQGMGAVGLYVEAAKANYGSTDFFDPNVMFDAADPAEPPEITAENIKEQSNMTTEQSQPLPDVGEGILTDPEVSRSSRTRYLQAAFGTPPKEYAQLSSAHAAIVQKMMRERNPDKLAVLEKQEQFILRKMRDAENKSDGNDDNKFDPNNIPINRGRFISQAIKTFPDLQYNSDMDAIVSMKEGQGGLIAIASARAAQDFQTFNRGFKTPDAGITATVNQDINRAKSDLTEYARKVARLGSAGLPQDPQSLTADMSANFSRYKGQPATQEEFEKNIIQGMYGLSDVVQFDNKIYIYVGYNSILAQRKTQVKEDGTTVEQVFPFYAAGNF